MKQLKGMICTTNGRGLWSRISRRVKISKVELEVFQYDDEEDEAPSLFGELRVYFPKASWDINEHGLIYTDDKWLKDLKGNLGSLGFSNYALRDLDYSEQGMQGDNYVSLDAGSKFIRAYRRLTA